MPMEVETNETSVDRQVTSVPCIIKIKVAGGPLLRNNEVHDNPVHLRIIERWLFITINTVLLYETNHFRLSCQPPTLNTETFKL